MPYPVYLHPCLSVKFVKLLIRIVSLSCLYPLCQFQYYPLMERLISIKIIIHIVKVLKVI